MSNKNMDKILNNADGFVIDETAIALLENDFSNQRIIDNITPIPKEIYEKQIKVLSEQKKSLLLLQDKRKMDESLKVLDALSCISNMLADEDVLNTVKNAIASTNDYKCMVDAYGKLVDKTAVLNRIDSIDSNGTSGAILLEIVSAKGTSFKAKLE